MNFIPINPNGSKFQKWSREITEYLETAKATGLGPLHEYQIDAVLNTKRLVLEDHAVRLQKLLDGVEAKPDPVLIVAPTGSGKSGMIVLLPYVLSSERVLVITPSKVITEQLGIAFGKNPKHPCFFENTELVNGSREEVRNKLENLLEQITIIDGPQDINARFTQLSIVNAQKFGGNSKLSLSYKKQDIIKDVEAFFKQFDTLIVDEAHHFPATTWENITNEFSKPSPGVVRKIIFLTATPYKIIRGNEEFILGEGPLAKKRIAYEVTKDMIEGVTIRRCEFRDSNWYKENNETVLNDIKKIFEENLGKEPRISRPKAMVLVGRKVEAKKLVEFLNQQEGDGFAIATISDDPGALEKFTRENFQVAVTCGIGKEGYDNPDVVGCIILRKIVKGRVLFTQFIGRCMRLKRNLEGGQRDQTVGVDLSYQEFGQRKLWNEREKLATEDPIDVDEVDN